MDTFHPGFKLELEVLIFKDL
uniref:Uncharacterized protein n=1 Tax=Rhizophora mucronata TaxID=61149 RepID=A0A2P2NDD8_RHIMU